MVLKNITMMHHRIIIVKFELLSDNYSASFDSHYGQISVLQSFHSLSFVLMNHNNFICGIETGGTFFDTHGVPRTQNGQNQNRPLGLFLNLVHAWYIVSHADWLFEVMGQKSMCKHQTKWRVFSCDQAAIWLVQSVCLSVCLSVCPSVCHTFFTMFPSSYHHEIFRSYYHGQKWCPCKRSRSKVKVTEVNTQLSRFRTLNSSLNSHMATKSCTPLEAA